MRIIDADELKTAFPIGEYVRTECVRATIDHMKTIDAIPVEWIRKEMEKPQVTSVNPFSFVLDAWLEEQEEKI